MQLSLIIGQIIALWWIVTGFAMIIHYQRFKKVITEICERPALMALSGFFSLALGSVLVVLHTIWAWDYQGLISLLCWIIFIHAIIRLLFPNFMIKKCKYILHNNTLLFIAWVILLIGLFLGYVSFYHIPSINV